MKRLFYLCLLLPLAVSRFVAAQGVAVRATNGNALNLTVNNPNSGHVRFGTNAGGLYMGLINDPAFQVLSGNGSTAVNFAFIGSDEVQPRGLLIGSVVTGFGPVVYFDGYDFTGGGITDFPISFQHASHAPVLIGTASAITAGPMLQVHGDIVTDGIVYADGSGETNTVIPPIRFKIDGQGSVIGAGSNAVVFIENNLLIKRVTLLADNAGSVQLDLRRCTYLQYDAGATHPASGDSIVASAPPTISTNVKSQDSTLTGWTKTLSSGDVLQVYVTSATTIKWVLVSIQVVPR